MVVSFFVEITIFSYHEIMHDYYLLRSVRHV